VGKPKQRVKLVPHSFARLPTEVASHCNVATCWPNRRGWGNLFLVRVAKDLEAGYDDHILASWRLASNGSRRESKPIF